MGLGAFFLFLTRMIHRSELIKQPGWKHFLRNNQKLGQKRSKEAKDLKLIKTNFKGDSGSLKGKTEILTGSLLCRAIAPSGQFWNVLQRCDRILEHRDQAVFNHHVVRGQNRPHQLIQ